MNITFTYKPIASFRLDLTIWALRLRMDTIIDSELVKRIGEFWRGWITQSIGSSYDKVLLKG